MGKRSRASSERATFLQRVAQDEDGGHRDQQRITPEGQRQAHPGILHHHGFSRGTGADPFLRFGHSLRVAIDALPLQRDGRGAVAEATDRAQQAQVGSDDSDAFPVSLLVALGGGNDVIGNRASQAERHQ
jgi:hypothetical protein